MELIKPFIIDVFGCSMNIEYALLYFSCQVKNLGVNALLVPTFWSHFYFGPYILFLPHLVPKPINA